MKVISCKYLKWRSTLEKESFQRTQQLFCFQLKMKKQHFERGSKLESFFTSKSVFLSLIYESLFLTLASKSLPDDNTVIN